MYKYDKKVGRVTALILIVGLIVLLGSLLWPYVNAFVGALILFFLLAPIQKRFIKAKMNRKLGAILCIIFSIILILVPLFFMIKFSLAELGNFLNNPGEITTQAIEFASDYGADKIIIRSAEYANNLLLMTLRELPLMILSMIIMYFVLFYLLFNTGKVEDKIEDLVPFDKKNSKRLVKEFKDLTSSGFIANGLIAILQGILLTIAFLFFGIKGAVIWGFIGAILSFLPLIGVPIIWIPAMIYGFAIGDNFMGWGLLVWGLFISNIDNILRPFLQNKIGKVHPLVSLIGVIIGVPAFGIFGIVVGPLLLSYFILTINMFKEEYIDEALGKSTEPKKNPILIKEK